jgi:hypothetical protein
MKIRLLLIGAVAAAVAVGVSSAVAAAPTDKGKPKTTGEGCKPRIAVILKGTLTGVGSPLTVKVTSANHWGKAYVGGSDKHVAVNSDTKVRGQGMKTLSELKSGFRVLIQARVCKADLANGATPALTATKVIAHDPNKAGKDEDDNDKGKDNKDKDDDE